jgi:hypothetical protein
MLSLQRTWPDYVIRQGYNMTTLLSPATDQSDSHNVAHLLTQQPSQLHVKSSEDNVKPPNNALRVRCVTLIRDPLSRLRSLYTYARSGGEHWFRYESNIMHQLSDPSMSLPHSIDLFWSTFGRDYLLQSHNYMTMNMQLGCVPIKMEAFRQNFSQPVVQILRTYGVRESAIPIILKRLKSADLGAKSEAQQRSDAHVTSNKFSPKFVEEVKIILMQMPEVASMVEQHRLELGY